MLILSLGASCRLDDLSRDHEMIKVGTAARVLSPLANSAMTAKLP